MLPTSMLRGSYAWPGVKEIAGRLHDCVAHCYRDVGKVVDDGRTMDLYNVGYDNIRVPCDLRRVDVRSVRWWPFRLVQNNVGSNEGLIADLIVVADMASRNPYQVTLLVDVNIFYRICKLMYSASFIDFNVRLALANVDLIFGVWHAYAHCVKRLRLVFFPWWCCLEFPTMVDHPEDTEVFLFPELKTIEYVLASMYCIRSDAQRMMDHVVMQCRSDFGDDHHNVRCAKVLQLLMVKYVPFLFNLGVSVRVQALCFDVQQCEQGKNET